MIFAASSRNGQKPVTTPAHGLASVERRIRDFEEIEAVLPGWDLRFRQISPGSFHAALSAVRFGGVQLINVQMNRTILVHGAPPPAMTTFSPITAGNRSAIYRGQQLRPGHLNVASPGDEINHQTSSNYENVLLMVDRQSWTRTAAVLRGQDVDLELAGRVAVNCDPHECLAANSYLMRMLRALKCRRAPIKPEMLHRLAARCVERVAALLSAETDSGLPQRTANPHKVVFAAERIMDEFLRQPLTAADLCRELDISERALRYAFQEVRGFSPMAAYKARRLNEVRRELKSANERGAITRISSNWGFWHTGEFSADYLRLFGERPSQTMGRRQEQPDLDYQPSAELIES